MAHGSACAVCNLSDGITLPTNFVDKSSSLRDSRGRRIKINELETGKGSGCQPCTLFFNFLRVFERLSPDFEASYFQGRLDNLFLQRSDLGTLLVGLGREKGKDTYLDHFEIYTEKGKP